MKYAFIIALFLLLAACAPTPPSESLVTPAEPVQESKVATQEEVVAPPQETAPEPKETEQEAAQAEQTKDEIDPYTELGCEQLLTTAEFAKACDKNPDDIVVTYKVGTKNCFVNMKDRNDERLTAGITLTGYKDGETAMKEFERRLVVLKVGADKSVGERAYTFKKLDRETINFVRDQFIIETGADTRLCTKEGVEAFTKTVDSKLD